MWGLARLGVTEKQCQNNATSFYSYTLNLNSSVNSLGLKVCSRSTQLLDIDLDPCLCSDTIVKPHSYSIHQGLWTRGPWNIRSIQDPSVTQGRITRGPKSQVWHGYLHDNTFWRRSSGLVLGIGSNKKLDPTFNTTPASICVRNNQDPLLLISNHILMVSRGLTSPILANTSGTWDLGPHVTWPLMSWEENSADKSCPESTRLGTGHGPGCL